jgi:hypothetical protein
MVVNENHSIISLRVIRRTPCRPVLATRTTQPTTCLCETMARRPTALHEDVGGKVTHAGPAPQTNARSEPAAASSASLQYGILEPTSIRCRSQAKPI